MKGPEFCFILYQPAVPGNIGAAARAIKTMGFDQLRLVDPADHLCDEARMMAHGSHDILEHSKVYASFQDAVADIDFVLCTTAKKKSAKVDYISSTDLKHFLAEKIPVTRRIGIVFGTEESGLPNSILLSANVGVSIPMATTHPSLNLAQSVMVIAYEVSGLLRNNENDNNERQGYGSTDQQPAHAKQKSGAWQQPEGEKQQPGARQQPGGESQRQEGEKQKSGARQQPEGEKQQPEAWQQLQERTSVIMQQSGIQPGTPLYHRIIERMSFLKASDARLAHSVTSKLKDLIDQMSRK